MTTQETKTVNEFERNEEVYEASRCPESENGVHPGLKPVPENDTAIGICTACGERYYLISEGQMEAMGIEVIHLSQH